MSLDATIEAARVEADRSGLICNGIGPFGKLRGVLRRRGVVDLSRLGHSGKDDRGGHGCLCHVLDLRRELGRVIGLDKDALDLIPPIKEPVAGLLAEEIADDHLVDAYLVLLGLRECDEVAREADLGVGLDTEIAEAFPVPSRGSDHVLEHNILSFRDASRTTLFIVFSIGRTCLS